MPILKPTTCLLCGGDAEIGPAMTDQGPRSRRHAILCGGFGSGPCGGYILATEILEDLEAGKIPSEVRKRLSAMAKETFETTGSGRFEITVSVVRSIS